MQRVEGFAVIDDFYFHGVCLCGDADIHLVRSTLPSVFNNIHDDLVDSNLQSDKGFAWDAVLRAEGFKGVGNDSYSGYVVGDGDVDCIVLTGHDASSANLKRR